jgi:hypothetical protein
MRSTRNSRIDCLPPHGPPDIRRKDATRNSPATACETDGYDAVVGFGKLITTRASTDFEGKRIDLRNCNKDVSAETHIDVNSRYIL